MNKKDITKELDSIFENETEEQKFEFEKMVLNSDFMHEVQLLMDKSKDVKTKEQLAKKLNVKEEYLSKLFASDEFVDIDLLAKLQRVFNTRFKITLRF